MKKTGLLFITCLLTACGGGGGSSPSTMPVPSPTPTAVPIQSVSTQRSVASEMLAVASLSETAFGFGARYTGVASLGRSVQSGARTAMSGWHEGASRIPHGTRSASAVSYSACANRAESATVTVSSTEVQVYGRTFYDTACTQLFQDSVIDIIATSALSASITETQTSTLLGGDVYDYQTLAFVVSSTGGSNSNFTLTSSEAASSTSPKTSSSGVSCVISSTSISCGGANVIRLTALPADIGATLDVTVSSLSSRTAAPTVTVPISGTAAAFTGAAGSLSILPGNLPAWSLVGASPTDRSSFSGTFVYTADGTLISTNFSLADTSADATATVATSLGGIINGTITQTSTGKTVATFTLYSTGSGTITYGNGSGAQVVHYNLLG